MDTQPIQKEILRRLLISEEGFRYSEMKPKDVESDLYNYHLQQLVKKELVEKVNDKYILTESGKLYIWDLKPLDPFGHEADKFKVAVNMILLRENNGVKEILFQLRTRLPFAGSKETIGRGIKRGESVLEAAKRGFREETGLTADFHMIGTVRTIRKNSANELINDMFYHVCVAETYEGNLVKKNDFGEQFWISLDEAYELLKKNTHVGEHKSVILSELKTKHYSEIPMFYFEDKVIVTEY